jgi:hypothetical protein
MKSGLDFIGFEIDDDYLKIARERIKSLSRHQKEQTQLWSEQNAAPSKPSARFPLRETRKGVKSVPSLLKWTGSKRSQASSIADLIPPYRRYFEPFLGGGAVLFLAAYPDSVAGDAYELTRPRYLYHFLC